MQHLNTGALALYHGKAAVITAINKDKIDIRIEGGSAKSVRPKDIEVIHPGPVASLPPAAPKEPDFAEILELTEGETLPFGEFVELAYGGNTAGAAWAAVQVLADGTYFTGSPAAGVTGRNPEEVAAALAAQRAKAEEKAAREALLERIRNGAVTPDDRTSLREIEQVAFGKAPSSKLLRDLGMEATPEKAHALLLKLGVWDNQVDPWPARFDVAPDNPAIPLGPLPEEKRADLTGMVSYAIDDEGSNDPDDAVGFADGLVWVHVADPAAVVTPDSPADLEARERGENLYLPERISHMLPPEATDIFGLGLQEISPAMSFGIRITPEGEAVLEKIELSTIRAERLTYESAAAHWEEEPLASLRAELERFKEKRRAEGALFIQLPEVKIRVVDGEVKISPCAITRERELVANAMLAAGSAVAKYAEAHDIALPFVVQPPPEIEERGTSFTDMYALRKACAPSVVQTVAGKHSGLGLEPYVRVTSPLRRYADLLAHQQLRKHLKGEELFTSDELEARLFTSEAAALIRRKLERSANEFWTLVYLDQHPEWSGEAILAFRQDDRLTFVIPELAYEFKNRFGGRIALGETVKVTLSAVDLAASAARLRIG